MRIKAEVLAAETTGDTLKIKVQGKEMRAACWRPMLGFVLELPDKPKHRRAFHIGRKVRITVETLPT